MLDYAIGKVVVASPMTVSIGADTAQPTKKLGSWTPVANDVVVVLIDVVGGVRTRVGAMPIT